MTRQLPEGWVETNLSQITGALVSGKRPKGGVRGISSGVPSIGGEHLLKEGILTKKKIKYVPPDFAKTLEKAKIEKNDILIVKDGATTGKTALASPEFKENVVNEHVFILRPKKGIERKFLFYFLWSEKGKKEILKDFRGSAQGGISKQFIKKVELNLGPTNEQKRIVDKIEALFSELEGAEAALTKTRTLVKTYRQAVLKNAIEGTLNGLTTEGWKICTLGEITCGKPRNGFSPKAVDFPTKVKTIKLTATTSGVFDPKHFKFLDIKVDPESHLWLEPGDILIQRANSLDYVGISAVYRGKKYEYVYPDLMMKIKPNAELVSSDYLHLILSTATTRAYFKKRAIGTAGSMPKINQKTVMSVPIKLPTLAEQKEIVARVEEKFAAIDKVEEELEAQGLRLKALRQSILKKAFEGRLVPQDPNDEPASMLLERIKEEKG